MYFQNVSNNHLIDCRINKIKSLESQRLKKIIKSQNYKKN
ncbi:hypothetical protein pb186bvf_018965 [Paramecium bursaria]